MARFFAFSMLLLLATVHAKENPGVLRLLSSDLDLLNGLLSKNMHSLERRYDASDWAFYIREKWGEDFDAWPCDDESAAECTDGLTYYLATDGKMQCPYDLEKSKDKSNTCKLAEALLPGMKAYVAAKKAYQEAEAPLRAAMDAATKAKDDFCKGLRGCDSCSPCAPLSQHPDEWTALTTAETKAEDALSAAGKGPEINGKTLEKAFGTWCEEHSGACE